MLFRTVALFLVVTSGVDSFSAVNEAAQLARSRLQESLKSPSGKLTVSPEILIPEPTDPTAILLQSTAVKKLSEMIRVSAKANSAWLGGAETSVQTFCVEQEEARGNFPGPVPVIYCGQETPVEDLADTGVAGLLVSAKKGEEIESLGDLDDDADFKSRCAAAVQVGIQPIPEIVLSDATAKSWGEEEMEQLVSALTECLGDEPAAVLVTINPESEEQEEVSLPRVPKSLAKKLPILGSVRVAAGENRMGSETARFKAAGFTGAIMRSDCVPGFRLNPDLNLVGQFWSACISDLKSTKSKSFEFRTRNYMDTNSAIEWAKYQKSVLDSGALGDPSDNAAASGLNSEGGDYKGF